MKLLQRSRVWLLVINHESHGIQSIHGTWWSGFARPAFRGNELNILIEILFMPDKIEYQFISLGDRANTYKAAWWIRILQGFNFSFFFKGFIYFLCYVVVKARGKNLRDSNPLKPAPWYVPTPKAELQHLSSHLQARTWKSMMQNKSWSWRLSAKGDIHGCCHIIRIGKPGSVK